MSYILTGGVIVSVLSSGEQWHRYNDIVLCKKRIWSGHWHS